jgi:hypothetical protein
MKKLNPLLLIFLPVISNIVSFLIFATLFMPGKKASAVGFKEAGNLVGFAVLAIEILAFLLIFISLKKENSSIKELVGYDKLQVKSYIKYFLLGLLPTLFAG